MYIASSFARYDDATAKVKEKIGRQDASHGGSMSNSDGNIVYDDSRPLESRPKNLGESDDVVKAEEEDEAEDELSESLSSPSWGKIANGVTLL